MDWLKNNSHWIIPMSFLVVFIVWGFPLIDLKSLEGLQKFITRENVTYTISICTFAAFLLTLYRQLSLEGKLNIHNKAILLANNKACLGLIDDIIRMVNSSETNYMDVNLVRERIEVHLEYCLNCCDDIDKAQYKKNAEELTRYESLIRSKIKNKKNEFNEDDFLESLRDFKRFLIKKDQLISNFS